MELCVAKETQMINPQKNLLWRPNKFSRLDYKNGMKNGKENLNVDVTA